MATIRETAYVNHNGEFIRVELIDCGFFRWEVAFFKQHKQTLNFDFYKVDEHGSEDRARDNFKKYRQQETDEFVADFQYKEFNIKIRKNWQGSFYATSENRLFNGEIKVSRENMTAEEAIKYASSVHCVALRDLTRPKAAC